MKFKKKPVVIEAIQWNGSNDYEVYNFMGRKHMKLELLETQSLIIDTLEGEMRASKGDWIIKGVQGEFYPCKPDIFEKTYERIWE